MVSAIQEWLHLLARWAHVVAAIMWIGDSFLFMWLDSHLTRAQTSRDGDVVGELWMAHSGGFYEVVKRRTLRPEELPPTLHWFKWESYTTWITGFLLLLIVYGLGGRAMYVDATSALSHGEAVGVSLGLLVLGTVVYDLLCRLPLIHHLRWFGVVGILLLAAVSFGLSQVFTTRAVFLHIGAMLGTIMSSNVFFRIIPAQRHMLAATRAGTPVDASHGARAKQRSVHNHYLTLPVLFTMLSNHFPTLYGHPQAWTILVALILFGVGLKVIMNRRTQTPPLVWIGTLAAFGFVIVTGAPSQAATAASNAAALAAPPVTYAQVHAVLAARCTSCHANTPSNPAFLAPPTGVVLDVPAQVKAHAERIWVRAVQTKTMPLGNLTGMTDDERALLDTWFAQGAHVQ